MKSYLKTKQIDVDWIGTLTLIELSAKNQLGMIEMQRSEGDSLHVPAFVCKCCVVEWANETTEAIEESIGVDALGTITKAIYDLSGIKVAKNFEPAPSADSSSS